MTAGETVWRFYPDAGLPINRSSCPGGQTCLIYAVPDKLVEDSALMQLKRNSINATKRQIQFALKLSF